MNEILEVKCPSIKAGTPTINGRIYTEEALKTIVRQSKNRRIVGMFGTDQALASTTHSLKELKYVDGGLVAVVELIGNEAKNKQLKELHTNRLLGMFPVISATHNELGYIDVGSIELKSIDLAAL